MESGQSIFTDLQQPSELQLDGQRPLLFSAEYLNFINFVRTNQKIMAKLVDISGGDGGVLKETLKESPNGKLCEVGDVVFCHMWEL